MSQTQVYTPSQVRSAWLKLSKLVDEVHALLTTIEQRNDLLSKVIADNLKLSLEELDVVSCLLWMLSEYTAIKGVTKAVHRYLFRVRNEVDSSCDALERIDAIVNTTLTSSCREVVKHLDEVLK